jgi:hypothetical protein
MGFKEVGVLRWMWVLSEGKEGNGIALRDGDSESTRQGRLSVMLSLCADGWESTSGGQGECATLD